MFPNPTAAPIEARMKASRPDQFSFTTFCCTTFSFNTLLFTSFRRHVLICERQSLKLRVLPDLRSNMQAPHWPSSGPLPLDPTVDEWSQLSDKVHAFLADELTRLGTEPVQAEPTDTGDEYSFDNVNLTEWLRHLFSAGFNAAHPGFVAYIPGGGLVTSALAEWIIKTTNRYGTANFASPNLVALEHRVIRTFAAWMGYGEQSAGVLTTGGSLANFTAVVTARRAMLPENFLDGVLYCSDQTHHSVMKAANLAGFSSRNLRILPSDHRRKLVPDQLAHAIKADLEAGLTPFMVIGSAGTTNTGSIDPLVDIAQICEENKLWLHVDAAYGGAFILTEEGKEKLAGIDQADSITLDPHKGLFLPYGTGCILVKNREHLVEAHEMRGDYMPDLDRDLAHLDPFSMSVELSREHRGLKLALPFILHGIDAFARALDEKLELTRYLHNALLDMTHIEVLNDPELTTIVFRLIAPPQRSDQINRAALDEIITSGHVYPSATLLDTEFALRISILSHRTTQCEIDQALVEIARCRHLLES